MKQAQVPTPVKLTNGNAGEESDNENEMSGAESEGSNASSRDGGGRRDSASEEDDSSDDSNMDEDECIKKRDEITEEIQHLEEVFRYFRELFYQERIQHVDIQLSEVRSGKSQEYLSPYEKLHEEMRVRTEVAGILRQLRLANIKNKYEAEEQAALQNLISEKQLAYDSFYEELMEKIRKLEEDRHNVELKWRDFSNDWGETKTKNTSSRRKAVTVPGPYIVYMLRSHEILEDWTIIRKSLKRSPT